ncbi:MAG: hypothetical protein HYU36_03415 [Planctomycetes bacterium]|nr:hypothetical protein [Planctomycetota bacterium]
MRTRRLGPNADDAGEALRKGPQESPSTPFTPSASKDSPDRSADSILRSLGDMAQQGRSARAFTRAFPALVILCLAGAAIGTVLHGHPALPLVSGLVMALALLLLFLAWQLEPLDLAGVAARADHALELPDTLSAYLEYRLGGQPLGPFEQAHLDAVQRQFPAGVAWRPEGLSPGRLLLLLAALLLWVGAACWPGFGFRLGGHGYGGEWPEASRQTLRRAADALRQEGQADLAATLERVAAAEMPAPRIEKERWLRRLREMDRELQSAEGRMAGEFLADLLNRSARSGGSEDALTRALRAAEWKAAADAARGLDDSGVGPADGDAAVQQRILDALGRGEAQVRPGRRPGEFPRPPASDDLHRRLLSLAESLMESDQRRQQAALASAREALASLARTLEAGAPGQGPLSGGDAASGATPPALGGSAAQGGPAGRKESVTPHLASGPGEARALAQDVQDTGMAVVAARHVEFPETQAPSQPVPRVPLPPDGSGTVRRYFEFLEKKMEAMNEKD